MLMSLVPGPHCERKEAGRPQVIWLERGFGRIQSLPSQAKEISADQRGQAVWLVQHSRPGAEPVWGVTSTPHCAAGDPPFVTGQEPFSVGRCTYVEASLREHASLCQSQVVLVTKEEGTD